MIIRKAYKLKLKSNLCFLRKFSQIAGSCRFVWNKALAWNQKRLEDRHKLLWYNELAFWLTFWKKTDELSFLKDCPSQALQQTLKRLDRAFKEGFDKRQPCKRLPRYKRKGCGDSFSYPQGFKFENRRVFLPKIGWVGFFKSQAIKGIPKNVTVTKEADAWYISVQVEMQVKAPIHQAKTAIGLDLGICRFATLSNGKYFEPLNSFRKHERKLALAQRKLAKQVKFSSSWKRQKRKISRVHQKIKSCRLDRLHWISSRVCKNHAIIGRPLCKNHVEISKRFVGDAWKERAKKIQDESVNFGSRLGNFSKSTQIQARVAWWRSHFCRSQLHQSEMSSLFKN